MEIKHHNLDTYSVNFVDLIAVHGDHKVKRALKVINGYRKANGKAEIELEETSDLEPCGTCGGTQFLKTGVCHVCQICGTSQGCS